MLRIQQIQAKYKNNTRDPKYQEEILTKIERVTTAPEQSEETDDLLNDCIELVVHNQQASVSMLQRRFRIGYNRAARIIDMIFFILHSPLRSVSFAFIFSNRKIF